MERNILAVLRTMMPHTGAPLNHSCLTIANDIVMLEVSFHISILMHFTMWGITEPWHTQYSFKLLNMSYIEQY